MRIFGKPRYKSVRLLFIFCKAVFFGHAFFKHGNAGNKTDHQGNRQWPDDRENRRAKAQRNNIDPPPQRCFPEIVGMAGDFPKPCADNFTPPPPPPPRFCGSLTNRFQLHVGNAFKSKAKYPNRKPGPPAIRGLRYPRTAGHRYKAARSRPLKRLEIKRAEDTTGHNNFCPI